jgi:hypothetical protein
MKVMDQDTGKPFLLDVTKALSNDLEAWRNAACDHVTVEVRRRKDGGGAVHFFRQCVHCGTSVGTALKKAKELESAPGWDEQLEPHSQQQREADRLDLIQRHVRIQRAGAEGFKREYDVYLKSLEWARRRARVLHRSGGMCEGCLERKLIGDLRGAFNFRHWLAHGRYWEPKLGRNYDFVTVYGLAASVLSSFPLLGL